MSTKKRSPWALVCATIVAAGALAADSTPAPPMNILSVEPRVPRLGITPCVVELFRDLAITNNFDPESYRQFAYTPPAGCPGPWAKLQRANGARVVAVSSRGHILGGVDFDDWNFDRREYDPWTAYGQSKTANALFSVQLDRLGIGSGVRAFAVHPGGVITDLVRHMKTEDLQATGFVDERGEPIIDPEKNMKTPEQGAATSVWCATSSQLDGMGGVYCENCDIAIAVPADSTEMLGVRPWAIDPDFAERLWSLSERLTETLHAR